ncbi:hypothetical protein MTO96_024479 [Rhipicephalus appendiculatus]
MARAAELRRRTNCGGRVAPGAPEGGHTPRALGEEKERRDPETGVSDPSRTPVGKVAPFDRPAAGLLPSSLTTDRSGGRPQPAHDRLSPPPPRPVSLFPTSNWDPFMLARVFLLDVSHPLLWIGTIPREREEEKTPEAPRGVA